MDQYNSALQRIGQILNGVAEEQIVPLVEKLTVAQRVATYGVGREGLVMRALAMRLYHLGKEASVVGEMVCQPVGPGDILLVSAGPGWFSTVEGLTQRVLKDGVSVVVFTANPDAVARWAGQVDIVTIPARTMANRPEDSAIQGSLPMGSEYEASLWIAFDLLVSRIQMRLGLDPKQLENRHTNLE